jgi:hypothetical protein
MLHSKVHAYILKFALMKHQKAQQNLSYFSFSFISFVPGKKQQQKNKKKTTTKKQKSK